MKRILLAASFLLAAVGLAGAQQPNVPTLNGALLAQQASATGTTGAVAAAIPASTTGKVSYLCAFDVSEAQTTAGGFTLTISGLLGGSFTYQGANAASSASTISRSFAPSCLVASAPNTAITVTANANANGTAVDVNVAGFQQ